MRQQLASIVSALETERLRLLHLSDRIADDRWNSRRDPASWSVAECVAHLNLTSEVYLPLIRRALDESRLLDAPTTDRYRMDFAGQLVALFAGPLPAIGGFRIGRAKTPPAFVPKGDLPRSALLPEFDRLQRTLTELVGEADGLPIDLVKLRSPFAEKIRYSLYSAFVIIPRHQERHLWQAEQVWR